MEFRKLPRNGALLDHGCEAIDLGNIYIKDTIILQQDPVSSTEDLLRWHNENECLVNGMR